MQPSSLTDAFKRLKNPELEKLKSANVYATNLGPGVPDATVDTFRLLKNDPKLINMQENKKQDFSNSLAKKVDVLVKQREEFHN